MTRSRDPAPDRPASAFAAVPLPPGEDLVAAGGLLVPSLVLDAYRHGIFPWYETDDPVLWWSPDPRGVLPLDALHVPRRLSRTMASDRFRITRDVAFHEVMSACDEDRPDGTWIHPAMIDCYAALHAEGHAHSLEVWLGEALVGGIYGVAFGGGFAAESMFHRARDASKVALVSLARHLQARGYELLDVQFVTPHLAQFGCREIPRSEYIARVHAVRDLDVVF